MDLFITQNSNYFVHRHFKCFFETSGSHIIYVRESGRGLFKKYFEIIRYLGFINTIYCGLLEYFYFFKFVKQKQHTSIETVEDYKLNAFLETRVQFNKLIKQDTLKNDMTINDFLLEKADVILANEPMGIKNITHAGCCNRIKDLKIRGTKAEPLFLQLFTWSGSKSAVPVDTGMHKYSLVNFNEPISDFLCIKAS